MIGSQPKLLFSQAGCCMVMKLPLMLATGEYRSVQEPMPSISIRFWFVRLFR